MNGKRELSRSVNAIKRLAVLVAALLFMAAMAVRSLVYPSALDSTYTPYNIAKARIRGAELTGFASLAGFDIVVSWGVVCRAATESSNPMRRRCSWRCRRPSASASW